VQRDQAEEKASTVTVRTGAHGFPVFNSPADFPLVTDEMVRRLLNEDTDEQAEECSGPSHRLIQAPAAPKWNSSHAIHHGWKWSLAWRMAGVKADVKAEAG